MSRDDEYADKLAEIATELVVRVRDDDPDVNGRWLNDVLPDPADQAALCFVLAAAVPDDMSWRSLTAWANHPPRLKPHGTHAAAERHRYHNEPLCPRCLSGERERDRVRKAASRARAACSAASVRGLPASA